jgi:DNA-binding XRE family transcriptional regulator
MQKSRLKRMQNDANPLPTTPISAREILALNIVRLRRELSYSQEDLALEAGLHRTFVAHVERKVRNISLDNVERLATALGVQAFELLMPFSDNCANGGFKPSPKLSCSVLMDK